MTVAVEIDDLQTALLERAKALANEYLTRAQHERDRGIEQANDRLRLREEREVSIAKVMAERIYRQKVQASEIKMREELDHLRWAHVQAVMTALKESLAKIVEDKGTYLPLLQQLIATSVKCMEDKELVVEVNARDFSLLEGQWKSITDEIAGKKKMALQPSDRKSIGGVVVRNKDDTIRIDNSFEGRMQRYMSELEQVVTERLFSSATPMGALFNG